MEASPERLYFGERRGDPRIPSERHEGDIVSVDVALALRGSTATMRLPSGGYNVKGPKGFWT